MPAARSVGHLRAFGGIAAILALPALVAAPAFAQDTRNDPSKQVRKPLEKLWSEYPLNPSPTQTAPPAKTETPPAETPSGPSERLPAEDEDGSPIGWILLVVGAAAAALAAAAVPVLRRGLVPAPTFRLPVPQPRPRRRGRLTHDLSRMPRRREGGLPMDHLVGRLLGKRDASRNGEPIEQAAPAVEPDSIDHALFNAYSVQPGSDAVSSEAEKRTEQSEAEPTDESEVAVAAGGEAHAIGGAGDYTQVGEHVAAVLTSAREGAAQLLAEARAHGERIGAEAEARAEETISAARNEADGVRDEAARIRSQAEAYSEETRASAETYADASRRDADDERTKTLADAEQKAREIRAEAERRARAFGTEARQRHEALARNVDRSEERVQELVKVFRAMTGQLEALVETDAETETAANVEAQSNGAIDDALKLKRSTRADRNSNVAAGGTEDRRNAR